jgi:hypothetical protein
VALGRLPDCGTAARSTVIDLSAELPRHCEKRSGARSMLDLVRPSRWRCVQRSGHREARARAVLVCCALGYSRALPRSRRGSFDMVGHQHGGGNRPHPLRASADRPGRGRTRRDCQRRQRAMNRSLDRALLTSTAALLDQGRRLDRLSCWLTFAGVVGLLR